MYGSGILILRNGVLGIFMYVTVIMDLVKNSFKVIFHNDLDILK